MKKRFITFALSMVLILSFAACGEATDANKKDEGNESTKSTEPQKPNDDEEVTLEDVLNHEVSPEEDFLYSSDGDDSDYVGLASYKGNEKIVVVPEKLDGRPVTKVDKWAINTSSTYDMSNIRAIRFSDSIVEFEELACQNHVGLEIVVLGKGTKTIGHGAFFDCPSLQEVKLNDGLENIVTMAFANCTSLKSITIPESVTNIESGAFFGTPKDFTIYGKAGSTAETFAKAENIKFVAI